MLCFKKRKNTCSVYFLAAKIDFEEEEEDEEAAAAAATFVVVVVWLLFFSFQNLRLSS
jgi:hypothetical protein